MPPELDPWFGLMQAFLLLLVSSVVFLGGAWLVTLAVLGEVRREERCEVWGGVLRWCLMTVVLFETWWWLR